jgi:hypothetical protein
MNFFGVLLAAYSYGNIPETAAATEISFTDPDKTEMGNSEELEGENIHHNQKMEGGSSKKEQSAEIKRGGKIQKLTVVDIGKQYLDSLKAINKELRRSWVQISVAILIGQKRHRPLCVCVCMCVCRIEEIKGK